MTASSGAPASSPSDTCNNNNNNGSSNGPGNRDQPSGNPSPSFVDTVIIGTGPAALILSYILNGHHPHLRPGVTHPDPQLQAKVTGISSLFNADFAHLSAHFWASRFSYSTQALPVNTLLDTLLRPLGDTAPGLHESCIEWRPGQQRIDHVVLGADTETGGQWQSNLVKCSQDIAALSYADLLTLPGYTMAEHMFESGGGDVDTGFLRPTRRDVSEYLATWPRKVGIESSLVLGKHVTGIERISDNGFYIASHHLRCHNIVLASGTFTELIPPRELLRPLAQLKPPEVPTSETLPLLVIGSGFSAADVILTSLARRQHVLHIFKWDSADVASPLRACHASAYPEYASVFRRMRRAAKETLNQAHSPDLRLQLKRRKSSTYGLDSSELDSYYEGLPNTWIQSATVQPDGRSAILLLERPGGGLMEREVCGIQYVIGRRGSLDYLDEPIRGEVLDDPTLVTVGKPISGRTLRARAEQSDTFEMAPGVFVIGALLGDSLIRHAYGGCVTVARQLIDQKTRKSQSAKAESMESSVAVTSSDYSTPDNARQPFAHTELSGRLQAERPFANGHEHLSEDREAVMKQCDSEASGYGANERDAEPKRQNVVCCEGITVH